MFSVLWQLKEVVKKLVDEHQLNAAEAAAQSSEGDNYFA